MNERTTDPLVIFTPSGRRGRFPVGTPVLTAARQLGVDLDSVCGGRGICSKCQVTPSFGAFPKHGVHVREDALSPWNKVEDRYHLKRGLAEGRRLGCQATIRGDVVIDVPRESQVHKQVVRKRAEARRVVMDPATKLYYVEVAEPDMMNPKGDLERLLDALEEQWGITGIIADLRSTTMLQGTLREGKWKVTLAVHTGQGRSTGRIIQVWPGFHEGSIYGVAVDVGSTTIACHLTDLVSGEVLASDGIMNPQIRFGEDLMSRVSYAMMNPGGAAEMTRAVRGALNALIAQVAGEAGVDLAQVVEGVFVGNPVMHHLLMGFDPVELGWAPFALATSNALTLWASEIELVMHPNARLYVLPCIAGHVGADCAAVVLSESPHAQDEMMLVVDVGTNAELVLGNRTQVLACSSPTGPAFEGAQISSGQRAAPGAIERVRIDPAAREPRFRVIGSELWSDDPGFDAEVGAAGVTGICGSGIIEAIAEMRLAGILDEDGAIGSHDAVGSARIVADGRTWAYVLHDGRAAGGPLITVTQNDVRNIQLAKAALYAGARLLMDKMGIEQVDRVVLAGAFGAHISPLHAMVLGMIPDCPLEKVSSAGNAAGTGARIALVNVSARREIERVVRAIEKVETAVEPRFQEHFVSAIAIPHKTASYPNLAGHVTIPRVSFAQSAGGAGRGGETGGRRRRRPRE
ncbi:MAG TPA: ASKHA domain-containing protein [Thermohalobaculum sp.]|nr:ASKHA domain-containing protein [Thermohalobaculum sp.]